VTKDHEETSLARQDRIRTLITPHSPRASPNKNSALSPWDLRLRKIEFWHSSCQSPIGCDQQLDPGQISPLRSIRVAL
jgi:hypothetical protein